MVKTTDLQKIQQIKILLDFFVSFLSYFSKINKDKMGNANLSKYSSIVLIKPKSVNI